MTLSVMRSIKTSSKNLSAVLNSSEIHARGWKYSGLRSNLDTARIEGNSAMITIKNQQVHVIKFMIRKSVLGAWRDRINR
jgi:hypothetical protein